MEILRKLGLKGPVCYGSYSKSRKIAVNECLRCHWKMKCLAEEERKRALRYISEQL
jgi:hypothetical protein